MSEMGKKVTKNGTKVTETQASKTRKIKGCRVRDQIRIPLPLSESLKTVCFQAFLYLRKLLAYDIKRSAMDATDAHLYT